MTTTKRSIPTDNSTWTDGIAPTPGTYEGEWCSTRITVRAPRHVVVAGRVTGGEMTTYTLQVDGGPRSPTRAIVTVDLFGGGEWTETDEVIDLFPAGAVFAERE